MGNISNPSDRGSTDNNLFDSARRLVQGLGVPGNAKPDSKRSIRAKILIFKFRVRKQYNIVR